MDKNNLDSQNELDKNSSLQSEINHLKSEASQKRKRSFENYLNNNIIPPMNKFANQKHLIALRNAVVANVPLIIIGSVCLILLNFPLSSDGTVTLGTKMPVLLNTVFLQIYRMTMGLIAVVTAFAIGSELAKANKMDPTTSAVLTFSAFMIWVGFVILFPDKTETSAGAFAILLGNLGSSGLFVAIISGITMFEIYRLCLKFNITIRMPRQVPQSVANSFKIIIPLFIYLMPVAAIRFAADFDFINDLGLILKPVQGILNNTLGGTMAVAFLITFFWFFGLSGASLVGSVMRPFWTNALLENSEAAEAGLAIPNMYPEQFLQWAIWVGGSGATLGLLIAALLFAKSKQIKAVSKTAIIPSVFNINEPVIFGIPIMLNIFLLIPFIFVPQVAILTNSLLMKMFDIRFTQMAPWTLPGPIGAILSAHKLNPAAMILPIWTIILSTAGYAPFLIIYDKQVLRSEGTNPKEVYSSFQMMLFKIKGKKSAHYAEFEAARLASKNAKIKFNENKLILAESKRKKAEEDKRLKNKIKGESRKLRESYKEETLKIIESHKLAISSINTNTNLDKLNRQKNILIEKNKYWDMRNEIDQKYYDDIYDVKNQ